jgi:glucose/arabinose dehydrogenase
MGLAAHVRDMEPFTRRRLLAAAATLASSAGCFAGEVEDPPTGAGDPAWPDDPTWSSPAGSPVEADVRETTAVGGLEVPWDLTFAGDDAFLTERTGGVRRFDAAALATGEGLDPDDATTVLSATDLPDRTGPGEGGTLGVAAHPDYPDTPVVFVYYTADDDLRNRVVRYGLEAGELTAVVDDIPAARWHNGGRITVGPDDRLWVLTGDAEEKAAVAQDPASLGGAVLRVELDGSAPDDNPDFGEGSDPRTFTLGHRNPQGVDFTPDGEPLVTEHGPQGLDEVSALRPGGNYGWDVARGGPWNVQYDDYGDHAAYTPPLTNSGSTTTWAPSGATVYAGDAVPAWRNRLFVAGLRSQTLFCVTLTRDGDGPDGGTRFDDDWLDDRYVATVHRFYEGEYGRLRHVESGPDGALYLLTSNRDGRVGGEFPRDDDDRVVRMEPR